MDNNLKDENSFMRSLRRKRAFRKDESLTCAVEKMEKGKRLKSSEFLSVHSSIWQAGPSIRYEKPHKWERITRDHQIRKDSAPF
jgi:hypothetical protein